MLLFIGYKFVIWREKKDISIHLMLLFIPVMIMWYNRMFFISIHLMLLFIVLAHTQKLKGANFNTSHVTVYRGATITRTQSGKYFNTSHVTVYRIPDTDEAFEMVFQYISCYCLSNSIQPLKSLFVKFQYISCYCLSDLQIFLLHCLRNFNTSHVTVYRFPPGFTISVNRYFNTSHVTVYHVWIVGYS